MTQKYDLKTGILVIFSNYRSRSRSRDKERRRSRSRDRKHRRDKDKDHKRDSKSKEKRRSKSRERKRSPGGRDSRDRERDRDRHRRSRSKDRNRRSRSRSRDRGKGRRSPPRFGGGIGMGGGGGGIGGRFGRESPAKREPSPDVNLTPEERDARTIFVMQLSQRVRARDVEEFFSSVGKIKDVRLIVCNKTRRFKGIAYVEFKEIDSVALVSNWN